MSSKNKVLSAIEIELFVALVFAGEIVATNLNLLNQFRVKNHFTFCFSQKTLNILCMHLRIFGACRFLRRNIVDILIHLFLNVVAAKAIHVNVDVLDIHFRILFHAF